MISVRKSEDRGYADHGWLKSFHTFSFCDYFDAAHTGFGNLRVLNEDRLACGTGLGSHEHRDVEIVSWVLEGALAHKGCVGHGDVLRPGQVQVLSAGRGVRHSEANAVKGEATHVLQAWLRPASKGVAPGCARLDVAPHRTRGRLALLAAPEAGEGTLRWHADARLYAGCFDGGDEAAALALEANRLACVHVARGSVEVNGRRLKAGDAAMLREEPRVLLRAGQGAEVLVFDLAP